MTVEYASLCMPLAGVCCQVMAEKASLSLYIRPRYGVHLVEVRESEIVGCRWRLLIAAHHIQVRITNLISYLCSYVGSGTFLLFLLWRQM